MNEARTLFNQMGIASVTIRKIALSMGISTGNLTYHFKRREDIVERLYFEMVEVFDRPIDNLESLEFTVEKLYHTSLMNFKRMVDYRFIWVDLHQTLRESNKIKQHFLETRKKRTFAYEFMIDKFIEADVMIEKRYDLEYTRLIRRLIDFTDFWISSQLLDSNEITANQVAESHQTFMGIFYPYLTSRGKGHWNQIMRTADDS